ncbi:Protein of unknown function [Cotesia congregata]|uniref:Uncharacterized protein n=1 Tax=Cotesia congregata TaxID=51543 RepID=A0A8J2HC29_COTCN|nr:Protein of unknown function [Cotesia congregata]
MNNRQKRGPYKRYLEPRSVVPIPKRTKNYRKAKLKSLELEKQNCNPQNEQEVGRVVLESYEDETENNPESTFLSDNCHNDNTPENDQLSTRSPPVDSALPNVTADIHNSEDENDDLDEEDPYNYCDSSDTQSEDLNAIDDDNHASNSEEVRVNNNGIEGTDENPRNFQDQDNNDHPIHVPDLDKNEIHYPKSVLVRSLLL